MARSCERCGASVESGTCVLCGAVVEDAPRAPVPPIHTTPPSSSGTPGGSVNPPAQPGGTAVGAGAIVAWIVVGSIVAVGAVAAASMWVLTSPQSPLWADRSASPSSPTATSVVTHAPSPATQKTVDPEDAALTQLSALAARDGARVSKHGQWVAQLASKWIGVRDPLQVTASGSHTFHATDILAEHEELASMLSGSTDVVLLDSRTYGKRSEHNGEAIWVTMALGDFSSESDVKDFCLALYPNLPSDERENSCMPNRLKP